MVKVTAGLVGWRDSRLEGEVKEALLSWGLGGGGGRVGEEVLLGGDYGLQVEGVVRTLVWWLGLCMW